LGDQKRDFDADPLAGVLAPDEERVGFCGVFCRDVVAELDGPDLAALVAVPQRDNLDDLRVLLSEREEIVFQTSETPRLPKPGILDVPVKS
jgi:hypothetical protein